MFDETVFEIDESNPIPPQPPSTLIGDERYLSLLNGALDVCLDYKPKFGQGGETGLSLEEFQCMYGADSFYKWVGLDSELMYAAHKAAGGMTSIYRQLGMGCQWIFNLILQDCLGLSAEEANWSYQIPVIKKGKPGMRTLSLDGRIELKDIKNSDGLKRVEQWLTDVESELLIEPDVRSKIKGVVFEVRQGYKSKDSKRQNADIANAANAYKNLYIPTLLLFSTQIDGALSNRYREAGWQILTGITAGNPAQSTYLFCSKVAGYDLAGFFERNSDKIKTKIESILKALLTA